MGKNFGAYSPDVDGCVATGESVSQTIKNMKEALEWHLEGEEVPVAKGLDYWLLRIDEIAKPNAIFIEIGLGTEIVGTKNAFEIMLSERGIYKKLDVDRSTVANWKRYLSGGTQLSTNKMEEMLQKAGWKVANQQTWQNAH